MTRIKLPLLTIQAVDFSTSTPYTRPEYATPLPKKQIHGRDALDLLHQNRWVIAIAITLRFLDHTVLQRPTQFIDTFLQTQLRFKA